MVRVKDIQAINDRAAAEIARGEAPTGGFYGFLDIDYLDCRPFVMFRANDCDVCEKVLAYRTFEPASLAVWCHLARTATGILDIGAFTGIYGLAAASLRPDLTIHAFEPSPYSMARLRLNRFANGLNNVLEHLYGVGDQNKLGQLSWNRKYHPLLNSAATFAEAAHKDPRFESVLAQIRKIDEPDFCATLGNGPLIKIDVEGAEALVMNGLRGLLPQKPDIILETFDARSCDFMNEVLAPYGYRTYFIDEENGRVQRRERLAPCDPRTFNRNQFLTTRDVVPLPEIA